MVFSILTILWYFPVEKLHYCSEVDHGIGHRFYCQMDLFCLITLFSCIYHFNENTRFTNGLIKCSLFEYLIIIFMLLSTCALNIISQYIPAHLYVFNLKHYCLQVPLNRYISCLTISVFEISYGLDVEQCGIFPNVSYDIAFILSVLENLLITAIPIIFSYVVFSLHIIC